MVRSPLTASGHHVDTFIVVAEQDPANQPLHDNITAAYTPAAVRLSAHGAGFHAACRLASRLGHFQGASAGILQWVSVSTCFDLVEQAEERRGSSYDWVVRMRTYMVLLSALRLPAATDVAYVPGGGMSARSWLRCCNDHLFICPRRLCRPYFTLIHNFNTANCTPLADFGAGGDGVLPDGTLREPPAPLSFPWHIARAYNATQNASCGRIRELGVLYAVARGDGREGGLTCENSLRATWRKEAEKQATSSARDCALRWCQQLSVRFSAGHAYGNDTASRLATLQLQMIREESRRGMHSGRKR